MSFGKSFGRLIAMPRAMAIVLAMAVTATTIAIAAASGAGADAFGQLSSWGKYPEPVPTAAEFSAFNRPYRPTAFGVDPVDDSVYLLDSNGEQSVYRLQKFSATGTLLAATTIPRPQESGTNRPNLNGIAVDHASGRIYLLQSLKGYDAAHATLEAAQKIVVYSTDDRTDKDGNPITEGVGVLHAPADLPSGTLALPLPSEVESSLDTPAALALDPTTHDLLILAKKASPERVVVARFHADGTPVTPRFEDTEGKVSLATPSESGLIVSPVNGSVYFSVSSTNQKLGNGLNGGGIFKLPTPLTPNGVEKLTSIVGTKSAGAGGTAAVVGNPGPQLAISPDGGTLYFTETLKAGTNTVVGNYLVRGVSASDGATEVVYGGVLGTAETDGSCQITFFNSPLVADNTGALFALDRGNSLATKPNFGDHVLKFGAGGEGCPAPSASFKVGGSSEVSVIVQKGSAVGLDASGSDLRSATFSPTELKWTASGPEPLSKSVTGTPAETTLSHRFLKAGSYVVDLRMKVTPTTQGYGEIFAAPTKTVVVKGATPTAVFSPSTSTPAAGAAVSFDAGASEDPTGGECLEATGCSSSKGSDKLNGSGVPNGLKTYRWDFGDGTVESTSSPTIEHAFANATGSAIDRAVSLTVTSNDEVVSSPVSHIVSVQAEGPGAPAVTGVSPSHGPAAGGTSVTVTGANLSGATEVKFGASAATAVSVVNATTLTATSPAGAAGSTVDVTATTPGGTSAASGADHYAYDVPAHTLAVVKAGTGSGAITCNGGACAPSYSAGTALTLVASASSGSTFTGWSGGGCSGAGACAVTLNADTTLTATFNSNPPPATCATDPALCPPPHEESKPTKPPVKCKKGFKKLVAHGKAKCVKVKKHGKKAHESRSYGRLFLMSTSWNWRVP